MGGRRSNAGCQHLDPLRPLFRQLLSASQLAASQPTADALYELVDGVLQPFAHHRAHRPARHCRRQQTQRHWRGHFRAQAHLVAHVGALARWTQSQAAAVFALTGQRNQRRLGQNRCVPLVRFDHERSRPCVKAGAHVAVQTDLVDVGDGDAVNDAVAPRRSRLHQAHVGQVFQHLREIAEMRFASSQRCVQVEVASFRRGDREHGRRVGQSNGALPAGPPFAATTAAQGLPLRNWSWFSPGTGPS